MRLRFCEDFAAGKGGARGEARRRERRRGGQTIFLLKRNAHSLDNLITT